MTFEAFLRAHGLRPRTIAPDGKWRRCATESHPRSRNGAYKLAPDGRVGWVQDWARDQEPVTWRPEAEVEAPRFDPVALGRARREALENVRRAMDAAREFYASCKPLVGGHPYLEAHGLDMTGCYGLKVDRDGWMVVPALRGRKLMTVQRIAPDGTKRFWKGAPVKGASYAVERRGATVTVLCEGLATGLALYAAVPMSRVVVAFNAGNMVDVAPSLPGGLTVVAADNDHGTAERIGENPGVVKATEAAEVLGCGVAVPEGMDGTDFCDLRNQRIRELRARRLPNERDSAIVRTVDAEIARDAMRHARFRAVIREAS